VGIFGEHLDKQAWVLEGTPEIQARETVVTGPEHLPNPLEHSATILTINITSSRVLHAALKTKVLELLEHLPEHADLEDVIRALHVRQNIARGIADLDAGRTRTSGELVERYRSKSPS
jgi:hypothetical protein